MSRSEKRELAEEPPKKKADRILLKFNIQKGWIVSHPSHPAYPNQVALFTVTAPALPQRCLNRGSQHQRVTPSKSTACSGVSAWSSGWPFPGQEARCSRKRFPVAGNRKVSYSGFVSVWVLICFFTRRTWLPKTTPISSQPLTLIFASGNPDPQTAYLGNFHE